MFRFFRTVAINISQAGTSFRNGNSSCSLFFGRFLSIKFTDGHLIKKIGLKKAIYPDTEDGFYRSPSALSLVSSVTISKSVLTWKYKKNSIKFVIKTTKQYKNMTIYVSCMQTSFLCSSINYYIIFIIYSFTIFAYII